MTIFKAHRPAADPDTRRAALATVTALALLTAIAAVIGLVTGDWVALKSMAGLDAVLAVLAGVAWLQRGEVRR